MSRYDLVVLGSGPAGQRAAVQAAKLGKRVVVVEREAAVGGSCVHTGTIPSKTFREAAVHFAGIRQRVYYGQDYQPKASVTARDIVERCEMIVEREVQVIRAQLERNGVELVGGTGRFLGPHTIAVDTEGGERRLEAEFVVLATGSAPFVPPNVPVDGEAILTSDDILRLKRLPRTILVLGAGVIGIEYASMLAALGIEVTVVDRRQRLLDFVDGAIVDSLVYQMRRNGVTFRLGEEVQELRREEEGRVVCSLASGKTIVSEMAFVAAGRMGSTKALDLARAGIEEDERGRIRVDEHFRTQVPHVYAVGDLVGFPGLASTAMEQGRLAACHAFGLPAESVPELFPYGIYSVPEISMVGRTEAQLTADSVPYDDGVAQYREIARSHILGDDSGMLKILFHQKSRKLLGVHVVGAQATELVHIGQAVIAFGGTLDYLVETVFNYPTLAECYKVAALDGMNKLVSARGWVPMANHPHPGEAAPQPREVD